MMSTNKSYKITARSTPPYEKSSYIVGVTQDKHRYHQGNGDMWPITWGWDGNLYAAAGDNRLSPMNFWRVRGEPRLEQKSHQNDWFIDLVNNLPVDPVHYCRRPDVDPRMGIKPASLLDISGCLYFAVELQNYGTDPEFTRQENVCGWIITSWDYGKTWNLEATPRDFFTGRLSSPHFVQHGPGYSDAPDEYVYATFPCGYDGKSYWENGDCMLLARVSVGHIIDRDHWEFLTGIDANQKPIWSKDTGKEQEIFSYPRMCGENHVTYNKGIRRYILGNYSFIDDDGNPRPNHWGKWPDGAKRSQLALYEAENLWGPWGLFYQDDNWGTYGDYQPIFPTKWMFNEGRTMFMVSAGTWDDYNFTVQRFDLRIQGD